MMDNLGNWGGMPSPQYGDLLAVRRDGVWHKAISIGGQEVVHLPKGGTVTREGLGSFANGAAIKIEPYDSSIDRNQVVKNALAEVGKGHYNLIGNNCEHFVTRCIGGIPESRQLQVGGLIAVVLAIVLPALLSPRRRWL